MKIFLLSAALRKGSTNKKLINLCAEYLAKDHQIDLSQMHEFDVPLYNQDIETSEGVPENAKKFGQKIVQADKIIFSVPEYNYSIPGIFKNLIDWTSRIQPVPFKKANILLLSASPAMAGGNRGFWQTRIPLEGCGAFVYPSSFSLANSLQMFDDSGHLKDEKLLKQLHALLLDFLS